jgi:ABC-2 type transport system permease protein
MTVVGARPLGRRVTGPTALGGDPVRLWRLTRTLAVTDFRMRFFGSVLGYLWTLLRPLMLFGVLYTVFSLFLDFGGEVRFYPVGLLLGIILFTFLSEATGGAVRSLVTRQELVRKVEFPLLAVPMASVLTAVFNLALNLVPVLVFLLAAGGRPRWSWLELLPLLALLVLLAAGLAMLLSALFVRYRDVEPIWDVVLQVLFYATPIFYTVQAVTEKAGAAAGHALLYSPFAAILEQARHAFVDPSYLSAADAVGGVAWLLVPAGVLVGLVVLGARVFLRAAPRVAEEL